MTADMQNDNDEQLARQVQEGNGAAYGVLIGRYEAKMRRYARKFLSTQTDIDDLVQDVFIKAYERIQSFDANLRFSPWLYRVAHNTFVNELRRKSRYGYGVFDADVLFAIMPAKEEADSNALAAELTTAMAESVDALTPKYREVIVLHYFENLSYQEISDVLQVSVSAVGVRMNRARTQLRILCEQRNISSFN